MAKRDRIQQLIDILSNAQDWVSASTLAQLLGTTPRTIRSYVGEINAQSQEVGSVSITSSGLGYRIEGLSSSTPNSTIREAPNNRTAPQSDVTQNTLDTSASSPSRAEAMLSHLIAHDGAQSIYELADSLFVSDTTLMGSILPGARKTAARFGVSITLKNTELTIEGNEERIRKLLGFLAVHGKNGYFTSVHALEDMFPQYNIPGMLEKLATLCQSSGLFLNNYALNNLLVHLSIILARLQSGNSLPTQVDSPDLSTLVHNEQHRRSIESIVQSVDEYSSTEFGVHLSPDDCQQVMALVALSTESYTYDELDRTRLIETVGLDFFDLIISLLDTLRKRYGLPEFEERFVLQLSMHMHNAQQRSRYGVSCPNPISTLIKREYAAVYDMAVYFAHGVAQAQNLVFSEDEIGFIAFHLGNYLEKKRVRKDPVTCAVVFEQYHDFIGDFLRTLDQEFHDSLNVIEVIDHGAAPAMLCGADMVISTATYPINQPHAVLVSPLLSDRSREKIKREIEAVRLERRTATANAYLRAFLRPELFLRNIDAQDPVSAITRMGERCIAEGVATQAFIDDVLLRESISSTSFTDELAVPHAIHMFADRSFLCVVHNEKPIAWGEHQVNIVIMIGMASEDMAFFQDVFDLVVELFLSPGRTARALQAHTHEAFLDVLTE